VSKQFSPFCEDGLKTPAYFTISVFFFRSTR